MAPISPPTYLQAGTYSARLDRLLAASVLTPQHGTGALASRSGVRPTPSGAGLQVTQRATPAMFVTVAPGTAYVQSQSATGGVYVCHNDANYDVAISAAHATLGRRDIIVVRVYDAEISGVLNQMTVEAVTGTPAGSPVAPAVPSGSLLLATVLVGAAAVTIVNANITDGRVYTAGLGGTVPAPAATLPANPYTGMPAYDLTNSLPKWWNGSTWRSWQDESYLTSATLATYLAANGYITQAALNSGGYKPILSVTKPSDTSRASTVTPTADPHLTLAVAANSIYWVDCFIVYESTTAADIQIGWTGPASAQCDWLSDMITPAAASGATSDTVSRTGQGLTNLPTGGGRGSGNATVAPLKGILQTVGTAGSFTIRWAQANTDAVATIVRNGSTLKLVKLA